MRDIEEDDILQTSDGQISLIKTYPEGGLSVEPCCWNDTIDYCDWHLRNLPIMAKKLKMPEEDQKKVEAYFTEMRKQLRQESIP